MAYTAQKPKIAYDTHELRNRIVGWGVDLDPKNRPAVPKEKFNANTGAHWDFPERQVERWPREKSPEHKFLTPVFGTACPPKGLSGAVRRYAYTFSEGRTAHWLLLLGADRLDVIESRLGALLRGRPDNPITETGVLSEFKRHGIRSRIGQHRADIKHQAVDLLLFAATYAAIGSAVYSLGRAVARGARTDR
ncbi:MAG: hypothetical protein EPO39_12715 [Candidatus Manganitrophaceae bacterium]|nr:MAG: hypothetical protein EPO39_12715 [Candidatus Manganitrophaceae bacterium]